MMKSKLPTTEVSPGKVDEAERMRYRAENALSDIERAEGHKRDRELMTHVKKLGREKIKALKDIC